jgi:hypothetical protein
MQTRGSTGNQLGWFNLTFQVRSSSNLPLFSESPIITPDSQPGTEGAFLPRPKAANSGVSKNFLSWSRQQRSRISFLATRHVFRCNRQKFRRPMVVGASVLVTFGLHTKSSGQVFDHSQIVQLGALHAVAAPRKTRGPTGREVIVSVICN